MRGRAAWGCRMPIRSCSPIMPPPSCTSCTTWYRRSRAGAMDRPRSRRRRSLSTRSALIVACSCCHSSARGGAQLLSFRFPGEARQIVESAAQAGVPAALHPAYQRRVVVEHQVLLQDQLIPSVKGDFERRAHRNVRAHGGIERHQRAARRVFQASFGGDDASEDGFAVLRFADLQVRCFGRRGNVIAGRIDEINLVGLAEDLTAEDEGGLGAGAALLQGLGTFLLHAITNGADIVRGIEYVFDCVEAEFGGRILEVALDGLTTACVVERLPAVSKTKKRSPGAPNMCILL